MHERRIRTEFKNCLTTFQQSSVNYFKTVRAWRPDSLYIPGNFEEDTLPMAGIEMFAGVTKYDEPTSQVAFVVMVYVIAQATSTFADEQYEDMIFDLWEWLWKKMKARLEGEDIGTTGEEEIVTKVRLREWKVEGREDVFRAALQLLESGYFGSWFRFEITTQRTNPI